MSTIKTWDGVEHTVTDEWHKQNAEAFPELQTYTEKQLEQLRLQLLHQSNTDPLSERDRAKLEAATKWKNVNTAWRWLAGRHYNEIGFAALDQVHGNATTHACGCVTQHIFDHNKAMAGEPLMHHAHYPRKSCEKHKPLLDQDYQTHYAQVNSDNASPPKSGDNRIAK